MNKIFAAFLLLPCIGFAQQKDLAYFIGQGLQKNPTLLENTNLVQNFNLQRDIITSQNKKPQVNFTADYLFAPFFNDNGKPISITNNPSPKAFGYDVGITNGGLYSAQFNVIVNLFNKATIDALYAQNRVQSDLSRVNSQQARFDAEKSITDQYILSYQFLQQTYYLQKIIDRLRDRKPLVEALVKKGLLQQNDYLLLDIQLLNSINDLQQMQYSYANGVAILKNLSLMNDTASVILSKPEIFLNPAPAEYFYLQKYRLDSLNLVTEQNVFNNKYRTQVAVTGTTGVNSTDIGNIYRNVGLSAALHVGVPISDGKQRKMNDKSVSIRQQNLTFYRDNAAMQLENNLRNARMQIDQWTQTVKTHNAIIEKQELLLDIIKDKVVQGQVTVMDYINALQDYNVMLKNRAVAESNIMLYTSLYNYYNH